eukprot:TRINITY_DN31666_c7_g1_i1.p1 TRINITY_DN31666_c7_g1~~TRINITY_DN31666_c7_g1_i1.p1  ORF type:complete len:689 (+),score=205.78 TRINITY_DN31666_c7_g1_i1:62-2068(+)
MAADERRRDSVSAAAEFLAAASSSARECADAAEAPPRLSCLASIETPSQGIVNGVLGALYVALNGVQRMLYKLCQVSGGFVSEAVVTQEVHRLEHAVDCAKGALEQQLQSAEMLRNLVSVYEKAVWQKSEELEQVRRLGAAMEDRVFAHAEETNQREGVISSLQQHIAQMEARMFEQLREEGRRFRLTADAAAQTEDAGPAPPAPAPAPAPSLSPSPRAPPRRGRRKLDARHPMLLKLRCSGCETPMCPSRWRALPLSVQGQIAAAQRRADAAVRGEQEAVRGLLAGCCPTCRDTTCAAAACAGPGQSGGALHRAPSARHERQRVLLGVLLRGSPPPEQGSGGGRCPSSTSRPPNSRPPSRGSSASSGPGQCGGSPAGGSGGGGGGKSCPPWGIVSPLTASQQGRWSGQSPPSLFQAPRSASTPRILPDAAGGAGTPRSVLSPADSAQSSASRTGSGGLLRRLSAAGSIFRRGAADHPSPGAGGDSERSGGEGRGDGHERLDLAAELQEWRGSGFAFDVPVQRQTGAPLGLRLRDRDLLTLGVDPGSAAEQQAALIPLGAHLVAVGGQAVQRLDVTFRRALQESPGDVVLSFAPHPLRSAACRPKSSGSAPQGGGEFVNGSPPAGGSAERERGPAPSLGEPPAEDADEVECTPGDDPLGATPAAPLRP